MTPEQYERFYNAMKLVEEFANQYGLMELSADVITRCKKEMMEAHAEVDVWRQKVAMLERELQECKCK